MANTTMWEVVDKTEECLGYLQIMAKGALQRDVEKLESMPKGGDAKDEGRREIQQYAVDDGKKFITILNRTMESCVNWKR